MKSITIKKFDYAPSVWDEVQEIKIDNFKWVNTNKAPKTTAKLFYDDNGLYIKFFVLESKITAMHKNLNDPVCEDSCVEFFVRPSCDKRYINFEVSAMGTMLIGLGEGREERLALIPDTAIFKMETTVKDADSYKGDMWCVEYTVPFAFLNEIYGEFDIKEGFYGNFFKCGDLTDVEHYGMWSPTECQFPNFHMPEYFGKINIG